MPAMNETRYLHRTKNGTPWADFWDAKGFPGPRSLPDIKSGRAV